MKYYIDESGNTGDLIMTEENLNFSSQEYFTLACIGIEDDKLDDLESKINELKKKYKIQNKELKFGKIRHIFGEKIGFVLELLNLIEEDSKILIEIVDKKYIIATNIVNCLINPPYYQPKKNIEDEKQLHLILAQWIYTYIPNEFFIKFSHISRSPTREGLEELFEKLVEDIKKVDSELSGSILGNVEESIDDYKIMKNKYKKDRKKLKKNKKNHQKNKEFLEKRKPYTYFLPLADKNKRGELIGILPHIASFTNVHARLNHLYGDDLSSITIVHDNHAHFDEIIKEYHQSAIKDVIEKKEFEQADFNFKTITKLEFHDDKNKIGLQIADIFAGLINKAIPYLIKEERYLKDQEFSILLQILRSLYFQKAINFVVPPNHLDDNLNFIMNMASRGIDKDKIDDLLLERK